MIEPFLQIPWPWYVGGVLIGLMVPALLIAGNRILGVSSTLRQICAACFPSGIPFLTYEWKKESWNLVFALGILLGGFLGGFVFEDPAPESISAKTVAALQQNHVRFNAGFLPHDLFQWSQLLTLRGCILLIGGGFLVGFGTRWAGGCTSGHGIMGLSTLQWPSLIAVVCFFAGGVFSAQVLLPFILKL